MVLYRFIDMMVYTYLLMIFSLLINTSTASKVTDARYPFIYLQGDSADDFTSTYGYYYQKNGDFVEQELHIDLKIWKENLVKQFKTLPKEKQNLLIYIHGLWADNQRFFTYSLGKMNDHIFDTPDNKYGLVVSFMWDAGIIYDSNQATAVEKGKVYAKIYNELLIELHAINPGAKVSFLNHSMGNKVFESLYTTLADMKCLPEVTNIIMASPDLDYNVFDKDQPLEQLCECADKVIIYHHPDDKTLGVSTHLNGILRLGQISQAPDSLKCDNLIFFNAIDIDDNEDFTGKMSNHRYFYSSPTIRKQILGYLEE
jgi:hypothetical protein